MFADDRLPQHAVLLIAGRLLFTSLFFLSGITHFTDVPYYLALMPEAVPLQIPLIYLSGLVELAGAAMILVNWRPRLGAWLLVAFLIPVTLIVHGYWMIHGETEVIRAMQQAHFLKGIALTGAALMITQLGAAKLKT